ncbi:MAG: EthD family reductase [Gemmatimonadales bacterium]|nr:EthD family reductase [Gemmatimonadales bacterium]
MRRSPSWWLATGLAVAACGKGEKNPGIAADSNMMRDSGTEAGSTSSASASSGPQAIVTVIYRQPKDTARFEKYYSETHVPLVQASQKEVGFTKAELTRFVSTLDGKKPTFYRQAELYFNSMDDLKKGVATAAFKKIGADLPKFATGGLLGMTAVETGDKGDAACPALVTVIYNQPKDSAKFEQYYNATHVPLVGSNQSDIGFTRADLTRFEGNLDGSKPSKYRQAELCFDSMDALKKGLASGGFKKVGGDLPKFATGGLTGLIGEQQ